MQPLSRTAMAGAALAVMAFGAQAVTLVGLNSQNQIATINTANISAATNVSITGLAAGDRFVGIDLRPGNNTIYGISLSNKIYTVNETTGAATFVTNLGTAVVSSSLGYGIDFNPLADFNNVASLRLISSAGDNYGINVTTGAVATQTSIGTGFTGAGYSNSTPLPTVAPAAPTLYYLNSTTDSLMKATSSFNNPSIVSVGMLGFDVLKANGFEVLPNDTAYAALNLDDGSSLVTGIYSISLTTGAATLVGTYNGTLSGLTVSAVPEPETYALMLAGLLAVGSLARRRPR
ncbi:MAG: DUF4394 domain-containing protein [Microbacteriaceae bacterium]|nr:DUF4394 domain-containing protein [Burkholderiaceae bacterium]